MENKMHKILWDFAIQTDNPMSNRRPDLVIVYKKKENLPNSGFVVLADHRVKLKESENREKHLELARELKQPWNMIVTGIPIAIRGLGTVTKGLVHGLMDLEIRTLIETRLSKLQQC